MIPLIATFHFFQLTGDQTVTGYLRTPIFLLPCPAEF